MNTLQKAKAFVATKKAYVIAGIGLAVATAPSAFATAVLENDTFEGLPAAGSNVGSFLTNLLPGIVAVVIVLGIVGGIVAIIMAVAHLLKKSLHK